MKALVWGFFYLQKYCSQTDTPQVHINASFAVSGTLRRAECHGSNTHTAACSSAGSASVLAWCPYQPLCKGCTTKPNCIQAQSFHAAVWWSLYSRISHHGHQSSCLPLIPHLLTPHPLDFFFRLFFFFFFSWYFLLILFSLRIELAYCKYACEQKGGREMGTGAWGRQEESSPCPRQLKLFVKQQPELRQPRWCVKTRKYLWETYWTLSKYPSLK